METIYIIGGNGFIGKNLIKCYYKCFKIIVVDKFIDLDFLSNYPEIQYHKVDLVNEQLPEGIPKPDYVINLASIVTAERDLSLFDGLISSNLKILLNLYERMKSEFHLKLFIQFGSSEEYGAESSPFNETMREAPNSPYALVKQLTTNTAMMLWKNYNFPIMVVRPGNLFGPLQNSDKFIPYVASKLRSNESLDVTPCEQKRDFIYVDDFAEYIKLIMKNFPKAKGEIVNVSSGESISLKEMIETARKHLNSKSPINYGAMPYRENEVMDLKCDIAKLKKLINTKVHIDNKERLIQYIDSEMNG